MNDMIDIVIPVLNEEKILTKESGYYNSLKNRFRIIFVDGGSTDRTIAVAQRYGKVFSSSAGRAVQKNRGAQNGMAKYLLFLHADSLITHQALDQIEKAIEESVVGGCCTMRIDDHQMIFRAYEHAVNIQAKVFNSIDGDLGLFVRKDIFDHLGGFDQLPVMEDIIFARKLRKAGDLRVLPGIIRASSRKWHDRGFGKTFWEYTKAYIQLWSGCLKANDNINRQAVNSL